MRSLTYKKVVGTAVLALHVDTLRDRERVYQGTLAPHQALHLSLLDEDLGVLLHKETARGVLYIKQITATDPCVVTKSYMTRKYLGFFN